MIRVMDVEEVHLHALMTVASHLRAQTTVAAGTRTALRTLLQAPHGMLTRKVPRTAMIIATMLPLPHLRQAIPTLHLAMGPVLAETELSTLTVLPLLPLELTSLLRTAMALLRALRTILMVPLLPLVTTLLRIKLLLLLRLATARMATDLLPRLPSRLQLVMTHSRRRPTLLHLRLNPMALLLRLR